MYGRKGESKSWKMTLKKSGRTMPDPENPEVPAARLRPGPKTYALLHATGATVDRTYKRWPSVYLTKFPTAIIASYRINKHPMRCPLQLASFLYLCGLIFP
jgi:hypothetical protein